MCVSHAPRSFFSIVVRRSAVIRPAADSPFEVGGLAIQYGSFGIVGGSRVVVAPGASESTHTPPSGSVRFPAIVFKFVRHHLECDSGASHGSNIWQNSRQPPRRHARTSFCLVGFGVSCCECFVLVLGEKLCFSLKKDFLPEHWVKNCCVPRDTRND